MRAGLAGAAPRAARHPRARPDVAPRARSDELTRDDDDAHASFERLLEQAVASSASRDDRRGIEELRLLGCGAIVAERYQIDRVLGAGGMGVVFAGRDRKMGGKPIALKWLRTDPSRASATRRFLREAVAAGPIVHGNVVSVFDCDFHEDRPYLVMELLEGESLSARIARGPFEIDEALHIALGVLRGVAAVHAHGIIHRDLKPGNVFLRIDPEHGAVVPKVLDFGIAKLTAESFGRLTVTDPDVRLGTPHYMAPEAIRGEAVDARTDIYSICVMLYVMLTERLPFEGSTEYELYRRVLQSEFAPPRSLRPDLPAALEAIIVKGMALDRGQRFGEARTLMEALEREQRRATGPLSLLPVGDRRIFAAFVLVAVLCMLVVSAVVYTLAGMTPGRSPPPLPRAAIPGGEHAVERD